MKITQWIALVVMVVVCGGCAQAQNVLKSVTGGLGGSSDGPAAELKTHKDDVANKRAKYYQDAKGLRPGNNFSMGKARPELVQLFGIDKEPVGIAANIYWTLCDGRRKGAFSGDKAGAEAYFKAYKELAKDQLRLKARDFTFWTAMNFQTKGNLSGLNLIEGNRAIRRKNFKSEKELSGLREKLAAFDKCPHAPAGFSAELIKIAEAEYEKGFDLLNKFFDMRLMENIKGKTMIKPAKHVSKRDQKAYKKMIPNAIAADFGSEATIKSIVFGDTWRHEDKWVWNNNVRTHIKEDYTRINVYIDLGADRPYYKCALLEGVKNKLARGAKSIKGARGNVFCESVPK